MKQVSRLLPLSAFILISFCASLNAKVSEDEAVRLGSDLTPMGAERAGNADGSIPAWTGSILGVPDGLTYGGDGSPRPDPYADEKPLFSVTAANVGEHEEFLTEGQKGLLAKYPETYRIDVYPTHRDFRLDPVMEERAKWNATHAELTNNGEGVANWTGGLAFPLPADGYEAIWNTRSGGVQITTENGVYDSLGVFSNGTQQLEQLSLKTRYNFNRPEMPVGTTEKDTGNIMFNTFSKKLAPANVKGEMVLVNDPLDYIAQSRLAYSYVPGTRRVRQAPSVGNDTPTGPGGLMTADDTAGFNGQLSNFNWKLIGKKEIYIPYHTYKFDDGSLTYKELLLKGHPNPDYMRFEKHRVWIIEASLKEDKRHIYGKRVFYVDEDTWMIAAADNYDSRGEIYRAVLVNIYYHYAAKGYFRSGQFFHDLISGNYAAMRLTNETGGNPLVMADPEKDSFYTPSNLRRMGRR